MVAAGYSTAPGASAGEEPPAERERRGEFGSTEQGQDADVHGEDDQPSTAAPAIPAATLLVIHPSGPPSRIRTPHPAAAAGIAARAKRPSADSQEPVPMPERRRRSSTVATTTCTMLANDWVRATPAARSDRSTNAPAAMAPPATSAHCSRVKKKGVRVSL